MKKLFIALAAIGLFFTSCNQGEQFKLTGNISGQSEGKVYLSKVQDNELVKVDSAVLKEGVFEFVGNVSSPEMYHIQLDGQKEVADFFLENANIELSADAEKLSEAKVVGSMEQDVYVKYQESQKFFNEKLDALYKEYRTARQTQDQAKVDSILGITRKLEVEKKTVTDEFLANNATTVVSGYLRYRMSEGMELNELEELYNLLAENVKASIYGIKIKEKIDLINNVAVGKQAPDFTLDTPEGQPLSLSSFKGKVVVIDFWASWCGPCRKENPHMVELYNEVHEKGVEFLGVTLDDNKEKWLKAIDDDGLLWGQVFDKGGKAAYKYDVPAIPFTVVIDKEGKIVAKDVFGDELKAVIEKAL